MNVKLLSNSYLILIYCLSFFVGAQAQQPAKKQQQSILLLGATAHLGNGKLIPKSAIGFSEGEIDMVLAAIDIRMDSTKYDTVIHIEGKHVYPGFIAPNSRLGLVEIEAVRASRDFDEVGTFNPHVRSLTAYNTDSRIIPTVRTNGVLIAEVAPEGGVISGTSSIFNLEGWNWEDAVLQKDNGVHLNWPRIQKHFGGEEKKQKESEEKYQEQIKQIKSFFQQALAYKKVAFHLESNLRFEAMAPLFDKKSKLFIHADRVQEITDAIYFFDAFDIEIVLVGAYDAWIVADLLKDRSIPILLGRVHALPMRQDDPIDLPFQLPKLLSEKGLLVGLENSGRMEAMGTRNLPFYAGTAVAYGLAPEAAVAMISLNTAKILGIDHSVGSIEQGKQATLFVSEGDALDMRSNKVILAFIEGKLLDLSNPQKELYEKYSGRE